MEMTRLTLDELLRGPEHFTRYLRALDPDHVVGYAGSSQHCPLATYLYDMGYADHAVGSITVLAPRADDPDNMARMIANMPQWAIRFVDGVDENDTAAPITASMCLEVLTVVALG